MLTIKDWMELVDYKITEGFDYGWDCYGPYSYCLSSCTSVDGQETATFNIVFSTKSQKVYEVEAWDYINNRTYRIINPKFKTKYQKELARRGLVDAVGFDFIDLELDRDFIQKALAIRNKEPYDTRIQIEVDFSDQDLLQYMKMAHDLDISFNEFIVRALTAAIKKSENDPADAGDAAEIKETPRA